MRMSSISIRLILGLWAVLCSNAIAVNWPDTSNNIHLHINAFADYPTPYTDTELLNMATRFDVLYWGSYKSDRDVAKIHNWTNRDTKVLYYRDSIGEQPSYNDWSIVNANESWFVHDRDGYRIKNKEYGWYLMDVGSAGWRNHICGYLQDKIVSFGYDGVFMDDTSYALSDSTDGFVSVLPDNTTRSLPSNDYGYTSYKNRYVNDTVGFLTQIKNTLGSNKAVIYNGVDPINGGLTDGLRFLPYADGGLQENFVHAGWWDINFRLSETQWKSCVDGMVQAQSQGKKILTMSGSSNGSDEQLDQLAQFSLGSFLLASGPSSYYYFNDPRYPYRTYINDWAAKIGTASGAYSINGGLYTRNFSNGKVFVNPKSFGGSIYTASIQPGYITLDGQPIRQISVSPQSAEILLKRSVVGLYKVDEGNAGAVASDGSTLIDSSGNKFSATPSGSPVFSSDTPLGEKGKSLYFDGVNDKVTLAANDQFDFGTYSFTVETVFKVNTLTSSPFNLILDDRGATGDPSRVTLGLWGAGSGGDGQIIAGFVDSADHQVIFNQTGWLIDKNFADGQWHSVSLVRDIALGKVSLYADGIFLAQMSDTTGTINNVDWVNPLTFGKEGSGNNVNYFNGWISTVKITAEPLGVNNIIKMHYLLGDANDDGRVDVIDLGILATNYGCGSELTWGQGDFNGDGWVDVCDLGFLASHYNISENASSNHMTNNVPEPTELTLLILGGLTVDRKNRKN